MFKERESRRVWLDRKTAAQGHVLLFSRAPKFSNNFTARSTYSTLAKVEPGNFF